MLKNLAIQLFFVMFIYSGVSKIFHFDKKTRVLQSKTGLPYSLNVIGMVGVILLEIFGSLVIIYDKNIKKFNEMYIEIVYWCFLLFLVVVTLLYHPPWDKPIPFLSNVTTFAGMLYLYADYVNYK